MLVVYDSLTGQGARFARRLGLESVSILDYEGEDREVFLVTRSYDFGQITEDTAEFLEDHADKVIGLAVSGNRNWGKNYGAAGDKIATQYDLELVLKFEGSGFTHDIALAKEWIENYREGNDKK